MWTPLRKRFFLTKKMFFLTSHPASQSKGASPRAEHIFLLAGDLDTCLVHLITIKLRKHCVHLYLPQIGATRFQPHRVNVIETCAEFSTTACSTGLT